MAAVKSSKDLGQLKNTYALLKSLEKVELWGRHIEYFIETHDLTSAQLAFVQKFKNQWIVKDLFEEKSTTLQNFTAALPQIKYKAQSLLGVPDAFSLLIDLPSDKGYYGYHAKTIRIAADGVRTNNEAPPADNNCHCSQTDPYCNLGTCRDNGCTTSSWGCGTLFVFSCNGVCQLL